MRSSELPNLGFGTAAIALCEEKEALATLECAVEAGIKYFDTAALYGGGQAELRLGQALKGALDDIVVSTKCGRYRRFGAEAPSVSKEADTWDFSENAIKDSIDRSCERLGREKLDVVLLHDIEAAPEMAFNEGLPVLRELQSQGRIGAVGAGCNSNEGLIAAIEAGAADVLLVAGRWTLLDHSAGLKLLDFAGAHGSHVVAGGILNSGCLAQPTSPDATFDYRPLTEIERVSLAELSKAAHKHQTSLLSAAIQFPGRDARIGTTLLGASRASQLRRTLEALSERLPDEFWPEVENLGLSQ